MIERISFEGEEMAIIIRSNFEGEDIVCFTPDSYSQQLGYMKRSRGYVIPPHVHNPVVRKVKYTKEVLFIKRGSLRVDFYTDDQKYIKSSVISTGDILLLASGGHGFEMIEESEIYEVKQGPFVGDEDKTRFSPAHPDQLSYDGAR